MFTHFLRLIKKLDLVGGKPEAELPPYLFYIFIIS